MQNTTKINDNTKKTNSYKTFESEPRINVVSKECMEERISKIFKILWETLSKSFGPYGAPTIISKYPFRHVTKDGFTIMKNLMFDLSDGPIDQDIANMASDICGRLNYTVGDGTTSAIIATYSIYNSYKNNFKIDDSVMPRDIMKRYKKIMNNIIDNLQQKAIPVRKDNMDDLYDDIYRIVNVSSNGDEEITELISSMYKELGSPSITCSLSPDGVTRKNIVDGYKANVKLADKKYINTDDNSLSLSECDVLVFTTKITEDIYRNILKPVNEHSRMRGRKLLVCGVQYDEIAIRTVIQNDLNKEFAETGSMNMVLCGMRSFSKHDRVCINDFATLMGTTIIDSSRIHYIQNKMSTGSNIMELLNMDNRKIDGIKALYFKRVKDTNEMIKFISTKDSPELPEGSVSYGSSLDMDEDYINIGYTRECKIGLDSSVFMDLVYNEKDYEVLVSDAKEEMEATIDKYAKLGTFNIEVNQAQERYYNLNLKMGLIEVGADSELSQTMIKDTVDDAIKAAASAYRHGIVRGCNLDLIKTIEEYRDTNDLDTIDEMLVDILLIGFKDVFKTVLRNAYGNKRIYSINKGLSIQSDSIRDYLISSYNGNLNIPFNMLGDDFLTSVLNETKVYRDDNGEEYVLLTDIIQNMSLISNKTFDISKAEFNDTIVNSMQTDREILIATVDLISILIMGNQYVIAQYS